MSCEAWENLMNLCSRSTKKRRNPSISPLLLYTTDLQSLLDPRRDLVGGETILPQDLQGLAGLAELIVDADLAEPAVDLAHQHIGHGIAQAADNAVFLHSRWA